MNYLTIKVYIKSNVNLILLLLKWLGFIVLCYQIINFVKLTAILWQKLFVSESFGVANIPSKIVCDDCKTGDDKVVEPLPLILLWNKYQLTGSKVYKTIFGKMTSGNCKVTFFTLIQVGSYKFPYSLETVSHNHG